MKYAVIQCVNGTYSVASESSKDTDSFVNFHSVCTTLWNAPDVKKATVEVIDENFHTLKIEYIEKEE